MLKNIIIVFILIFWVNTAGANQFYVGLDVNEIEVNSGAVNLTT